MLKALPFRASRTLAILVALLVTSALPALASHFRYGHLSWRPVAGVTNGVEFEFRGAFRRSGYSGTAPDGRPAVGDTIVETIGATGLAYGDGASSGTLRFLVTSIDTTRDTLEGLALDPGTNMPLIRHDYSGPGPWNAAVSGCCRIGALSNNPNGSYRVATVVDLGIPGSSPVSAMPAIVTAGENAVTQIPVPAADGDPNTTLSWRFGTTFGPGATALAHSYSSRWSSSPASRH